MAKSTLRIRRMKYEYSGAAAQLAELRRQLSAHGNIVSARGRQLTMDVFGEALTPQKVVERICGDVREQGTPALFHYSEKLDGVKLTPETLRVSDEELKEAHAGAAPDFLETVRRVRQNIMAFQLGLLHGDAVLRVAGRHELRLRYRPMKRIGIMVPGGAAAYPSTLLMTVCPALAAGVKEIAVVMPPTAHGAKNPDLLAVCHELGVTEVYRVGGAQAVAALAYGVDGIAAVDMIVGPGNQFVALAKRLVQGEVGIDCIAGPSEVVVMADATARADFVAADLIAQAEHGPGASILVTWHEPLVAKTEEALAEQLAKLPRSEIIRDSLERFGALVITRRQEDAIDCVNALAPEHLHVATRDAEALVDKLENAGAIFVGHYAPVALGDYAAGPSHVLPTGGTARFASGLSANDFMRRTSVLKFSRLGLAQIADDVLTLAAREGLGGHAASVSIRLNPAAAGSRNAASMGEISS